MVSETSRLSAAEIFDRVEAGAEEELGRRLYNLAFSAVSAGVAMGLSGLGVAVLLDTLGHDRVGEAVAYLAYPIGFLTVIIGRMQLFTENTLFPVAVVLRQRRLLGATARLWLVVLAGNIVGTLLFALLATRTGALTTGVAAELTKLGVDSASRSFGTVFWTAVVGGWIIALVAWLVTASTDTTGQILITLSLTYLVGVGHFAHSIAGSGEVLTAVLSGALPITSYLSWLAGAVLGNSVGGVLIVALFNYGQVHQRASEDLGSIR